MSKIVKKINAFFRYANKADVDKILSVILLSDRQNRIFDMYYIKKNDIGFISDSLGTSYSVIKSELKTIRSKLLKEI